MKTRNEDEVYTDWIIKWRLWKNACVDCDEQVSEFFIKFISNGRNYLPNDHADFAASISNAICRCKIDKEGIIEVFDQSSIRPSISVLFQPKGCYTDRFGIVSIKLSFFKRKDILKVALILENLGHGVVHDDGRIVSTLYANDSKHPQKMPSRDDPIWLIVKEVMPKQTV